MTLVLLKKKFLDTVNIISFLEKQIVHYTLLDLLSTKSFTQPNGFYWRFFRAHTLYSTVGDSSDELESSLAKKKMQLDVDIEPTFTFSYIKCIDKQKDITMKQLSRIFHPSFKVLAPLTYLHRQTDCKWHIRAHRASCTGGLKKKKKKKILTIRFLFYFLLRHDINFSSNYILFSSG